MSQKTKIQWCETSWNPIRGCSMVSTGCSRCYAERVAARFSGPGLPYEGTIGGNGKWNGVIKLVEEHLLDPLRWKRPRRVFVNSMSDLFHENCPDEWVHRVFMVMASSRRHIFQILTKRPERMADYFKRFAWGDIIAMARQECENRPPFGKMNEADHLSAQYQIDDTFSGTRPSILGEEHYHDAKPPRLPQAWPLPNIWLGCSVENQATADERIPHLLRCPAAVRFLSVEPLLGPVEIQDMLMGTDRNHGNCMVCGNTIGCECPGEGPMIHWVIVGGESGSGARPCNVEWVRSIVQQCKAAGVACFIKQFGSDALYPSGVHCRLKDSKGGDPSEWPSDLRVREFPTK